MNRVAIFDALYQRLSVIEGIKSASKRLSLPVNVEPSRQPHMMFEVGEQQAITEPGKPTQWALMFRVYVVNYDASPDGPMPLLLTLADRLEDALEAQPGEVPMSGIATTLGGQVVAARIAGSIEFDTDPMRAAQGGFRAPIEVITL